MAERRRPPPYNPEFSTSSQRTRRLSSGYPSLPPPYGDNRQSPVGSDAQNAVRSHRACRSLPRRVQSRSRPALSDIAWDSGTPAEASASATAESHSQSASAGTSGERRRCNSVGRTQRRRFQFDTIGRERGKRITNDISSVPPPPPRQLPGEPVGSPIKCLQRFHVYSTDDITGQSTHTLTCVDISDAGSILVIDSHLMLVHIFTSHGNCAYPPFKVLGVRGGCFWTEKKLVLATHRGLKICRTDGSAETEISIGPMIGAKRYRLSFIAIQRQCLTVYGGSGVDITAGATITKVRSSGLLKRAKNFVEIADVAVGSSKMLAVLDIGRNTIYRIDERGIKHSKIVASEQLCGTNHFSPGLAIDRRNNVLVCDRHNKRLLLFQSTGKFTCCLLNFSVQIAGTEVAGVPLIHGLAMNALGQLFMTVSGENVAEIRKYRF